MREQVLRCGRNIFQKKTRSSSTIKFTERNNLRQPASPSKKNIKKSPDLVTNQAIVHGEPAHHIFFKYQVRIVWNMIISLNTIEGVQVERIALGPRRTRGFCQRFFTIKGRPRGQIAALVGSLSLSLSLSLSHPESVYRPTTAPWPSSVCAPLSHAPLRRHWSDASVRERKKARKREKVEERWVGGCSFGPTLEPLQRRNPMETLDVFPENRKQSVGLILRLFFSIQFG